MSDLISRQVAIDALNNAVCDECVCRCAKPYSKDCYAIDKYSAGIRIIKKLPSAQPERKKGKWINYDKKYMLATCSKCNKITMFELWGTKVKFYDYCPNCGAEMER